MKKLSFLLVISIIFIVGCTSTPSTVVELKQPSVVIKGDLKEYSYAYIKPTTTVNSSVASGFISSYGGAAHSEDKMINPKDFITGCLIKHGFIVVDEIPADKNCLLVSYGECGGRQLSYTSYTTEVSIQFISSKTKELVATTTAEGMGKTEIDDIKIAIQRAIEALFQ